MLKPFTFGVELEFNVDYLDGHKVPPSETKVVIFSALPNEKISHEQNLRTQRVMAHLRRTIAEAHFNIDTRRSVKDNINNWDVRIDISIRSKDDEDLKEYVSFGQTTSQTEETYTDEKPDVDPTSFSDQESCIDSDSDSDKGLTYYKVGVEVVSPALSFNEESLDQIKRICELLNSTYRITTNTTCGLHVHLGHHSQGFPLADLKKLTVFLHTFEPQLSSLHPINRYSQYHCYAMRQNSQFTFSHQRKYNRIPTLSEYASNTFACKTRWDWFQQAADRYVPKNCTYNIQGVSEAAPENGVIENVMYRQTIEFRQHEGTTDATRIIQWIRTVVGLVTYVERSHAMDFIDLLTSAWAAEKWEKMGDGRDARRAAEMGPALADHGFTIIDLLNHIGLTDQANYYKILWHKHVIKLRALYLGSDISWDFQTSGLSSGVDEWKGYLMMTERFNDLRLLRKSEENAGIQLTPLDDSMFPDHKIRNNWAWKSPTRVFNSANRRTELTEHLD